MNNKQKKLVGSCYHVKDEKLRVIVQKLYFADYIFNERGYLPEYLDHSEIILLLAECFNVYKDIIFLSTEIECVGAFVDDIKDLLFKYFTPDASGKGN